MNFEVEYNPKNNKENIYKKYAKTVKRKKKKINFSINNTLYFFSNFYTYVFLFKQ